jgi:radical SAM protein with 4Fe4S-binding SPASM domain
MMMRKIKLPGVIYEITTACNLKCKYCYNYWKKENENVSDIQKYNPKKTLKQFSKYVAYDGVTFSGGEPTTNFEELLDCVMYAKARNKRVTIITNANLLDSEKIKILSKLKVDLFEITINSYNKEIHENINGIKGSFDKSINAIKEIQNNGIEVVVPIVVTKYNVNDIEKTLEFLHSLGIKRIMINRYNIGGNGCNEYNDILPDFKDLKNAYEKCQKFAEKYNTKLYSLVCTPYCVLDPKDYPNISFSNCNFNNLNRRYTLSRDGNIRYCNHSPEIIGNVYENKMSDIMSSSKLKRWSEIEPAFCKTCNKKEDCEYGCRAASQQMGLGLEAEDPIVKIYGIVNK